MSKTIEELQAELAVLEGKRPQPAAQTKPATAAFEFILKDEWCNGSEQGQGNYETWRATEGERLRLEHDEILLEEIAAIQKKEELAPTDLDDPMQRLVWKMAISLATRHLSYNWDGSGYLDRLSKKTQENNE